MSTPAPTHRTWLKQLASQCEAAWQTAVLPSAEEGRRRIETRRTVYELFDGECVEIVRRDDGAEVTGMQGMRLVGWYYDLDGTPHMAKIWRPGARAILWRPRRNGEPESVIALTSPTFGFVCVGRTHDEMTTRPRIDDTPVSHVRPVVVARTPPAQSMARVHTGF